VRAADLDFHEKTAGQYPAASRAQNLAFANTSSAPGYGLNARCALKVRISIGAGIPDSPANFLESWRPYFILMRAISRN
jgi:hypothetical protein